MFSGHSTDEVTEPVPASVECGEAAALLARLALQPTEQWSRTDYS